MDTSTVVWVIDLIVVAALLLAGGIIRKRMLSHADRVNDYFMYALIAYTRFNDEDAKVAAIAAGKVAGRKQRNSMVVGLRAYASELAKTVSEHPELEPVMHKVSEIATEMSAKDWAVRDAAHEKQRLHERNPKYLKALNKADPNVFVRKYGDLSQY